WRDRPRRPFFSRGRFSPSTSATHKCSTGFFFDDVDELCRGVGYIRGLRHQAGVVDKADVVDAFGLLQLSLSDEILTLCCQENPAGGGIHGDRAVTDNLCSRGRYCYCNGRGGHDTQVCC